MLAATLSITLLSAVSSSLAPQGGGNGRVLIIGLDGVRADALRLAPTPNIDGLIQAGAVTWTAFVGGALSSADPTHQATSSGPGWASILTGVWVDKHGVSDNSFQGNNLAAYPHFFAHVRNARPNANLASIVHWDPINTQLLDPFAGLASFTQELSSDVATANAAVNYLTTSDPDALFVHFDDGDGAGHQHGFSPGVSQYMAEMTQLDAHIGTVIAALQARPNYATENWLVLATTDHGGRGTSHGGHSPSERQTWMLASGGATSNSTIDPGPGMTAIARTALEHLGIAIQPAWGLVDAEPFAQPRAQPYSPLPRHVERGVAVDTNLQWAAAQGAVQYSVYLATTPFLTAAHLAGVTANTVWQPGRLAADTTWFWRVDTATTSGSQTGSLWAFTTAGSILDGLVLHADYHDRVTDASGHLGNPVVGGSPQFAAGQEGRAIAFGSSSDYVSYGTPPELGFGATTDFSVSFWIRSTGFSGDPVFVSNKNWVSGSNTGWVIAGDAGGTWQWNFCGANGSRIDHDRAGAVADGAWHHIVVTHDRDGQVSFYQDGQWHISGELASPGTIDALPTAVGQDGTLSYSLGNTATIDELRIWRRVLGRSEVARLWGGGPGAAWRPLVGGSIGADGIPELDGTGSLTAGSSVAVLLDHAAPSSLSLLALGFAPTNLPFFGALLAPNPVVTTTWLSNGSGHAALQLTWPGGLPAGSQLWFQAWVLDAAGPFGVAASRPLLVTTP